MAPAKANSIATAKPNAQTAGMNRLEEGPRCMENYGSELAAVVKVAGARLSKFLNIETQAPEERSVEPGERGVGIADSAQSKYSGVLRILTRPLDIKDADKEPFGQLDAKISIDLGHRRFGVIVKGVNIQSHR